MSQTEQIIKYLKEYGTITSFEAYVDLGITQLAARISELQEQGYCFKRVRKQAKNRFGNYVSFIEYSLAEE